MAKQMPTRKLKSWHPYTFGNAAMLNQPVNALISIKTLAFQQIPLTLTTGYRGLLFDERIKPLKISADQIVFSAPRQHILITLGDPLYLHSHALPESVRASLLCLNTAAGEMTLTNFRFSGIPWRDRCEQRVQPVKPLNAMLTIDRRIYQASLVDLSLHGAGVTINGENEQAPMPALKSSIDINFQLDSQTRLSMRSTVAYVRKGGACLVNLGLRLFPTPNQEILLESFITRRKIEIMNELQQQARERMDSGRVVSRLR
jgi:hypothetical protein